MFYERLIMACAIHNTTPTAICRAIGLSEAAATRWKQGSKPHDTTIKKIADHLGVSVFFFWGEDFKKTPIGFIDEAMTYEYERLKNHQESEAATTENPIIEKIEEALKELTEEELKEVDRYVDYLVNRKK